MSVHMTAPSITELIGSAEIFHRVYSKTLLVLSHLQYDQPSNRTWITLPPLHTTNSRSYYHLIIRQESVYRNTFETPSSYDNNFICLTSCFVFNFQTSLEIRAFHLAKHTQSLLFSNNFDSLIEFQVYNKS